MLPDDVASIIESHLHTRIDGAQSLGGGCIAHASRLDTSDGPLFLKWSRESAGAAFPAEAEGLRALRAADTYFFVPEPLLAVSASPPAPGLLVLEWIEPGVRADGFWTDFGVGLADLHRHTGERYGFDSDNFIGRLPQRNDARASWPEFFAVMRLEPQVRRARDAGRWQEEWSAHVDRLMTRLHGLLPEHPEPSLLHGDLWSGNFLVTAGGRAALVDPAVYYGHREADLAMTELFGGYDSGFYTAYRHAWPIEAGYEVRRDIYNLYHLINHLNHFGAGYAGSVDRMLTKF